MEQNLEQLLKEAPAPTLTLEPFPEEMKEAAAVVEEPEKEVDERENLKALLTPTEQKQVDAFVQQQDRTKKNQNFQTLSA